MTIPPEIRDELADLFWSLSDGSFSPAGVERVEQLAQQYPEVQALYAQFMVMCGVLQWDHATLHAVNLNQECDSRDDECGTMNDELPASPPSVGVRLSADHSSFIIHHPSFLQGLLSNALFSYAIAAMILSTGVLASWIWKCPDAARPDLVANGSPITAPESDGAANEPIGLVTGAVNCQWADPKTAIVNGVLVPLGRKFGWPRGFLR